MRRAIFRSLLFVFSFVFSFDLSAQQQLASLHPQTALVWQRTSPTAQKPDGPVLYQIIFRSSAIPGNVPMISPQFTLTNSPISVVTGVVNIGGPNGLIIDSAGNSLTFAGVSLTGGGASGLTVVSHDSSLTGSGTAALPLGIATGGVTITRLNAAGSAAGQVLTSNGASVGWQNLPNVPAAWNLMGNSGTNCSTSPCFDFIGTTDNSAFEIKVNSSRTLRFESQTDTIFGGIAPNVIAGSSANAANANVYGATIAGGGETGMINGMGAGNTVAGAFGTVGGGLLNIAGQSNSREDTIAGGAGNRATGGGSVVSGGENNSAFGQVSTISGGADNRATSNADIVSGGVGNKANGGGSTVAGGSSNTASGSGSTIAGGSNNTASGSASFAAGTYADTNNQSGAFVWGDDSTPLTTNHTVVATAANQFVARATGGFDFWTGIDANGNVNVGATLAPGMSAWSSLSDLNAKSNFQPVDAREILRRLALVPITTWNYKSADAPFRHIGPMAQDFYAAFNVGEDDKHITTIDADGVALAAIQGLNQKLEDQVKSLRSELEKKDSQLAEQHSQLSLLAEQIKALRAEFAHTRTEVAGSPEASIP